MRGCFSSGTVTSGSPSQTPPPAFRVIAANIDQAGSSGFTGLQVEKTLIRLADVTDSRSDPKNALQTGIGAGFFTGAMVWYPVSRTAPSKSASSVDPDDIRAEEGGSPATAAPADRTGGRRRSPGTAEP